MEGVEQVKGEGQKQHVSGGYTGVRSGFGA